MKTAPVTIDKRIGLGSQTFAKSRQRHSWSNLEGAKGSRLVTGVGIEAITQQTRAGNALHSETTDLILSLTKHDAASV